MSDHPNTLFTPFTKRPVTVLAVQLTPENMWDVRDFIASAGIDANVVTRDCLRIHTLEGNMDAFPGDWVIRGVAGEFYPCKDAIFRETYQLTKFIDTAVHEFGEIAVLAPAAPYEEKTG